MTVLEQEKSVTTMSDRYITPEYLAHLPTSVSFKNFVHERDSRKSVHSVCSNYLICNQGVSRNHG